MQAKLVVTGGKATAKEIALKLPAIVGRAKEAGVRIVHSSVSRKHCEIYEFDGALVVRDNGSTNGTYLGADRVEGETVVKPGDELTIGPLTFRVEYEHKGKFPTLRKPADKSAAAKSRKVPEIVFDNDESPPPAPMTEPHAKPSKSKPPQPKKKAAAAIEETLFFEPEAEVQAADESAATVESPPAEEVMDEFFASLADSPPEAPVDESPPPATIEENVPPWAIEESPASEEAEDLFAPVDDVENADIEDATAEPAEAEPAAGDDAFAAWLGQPEAEAEAAAPEAAQPSEEVDEFSQAPAAAEPAADEDVFAAWLNESPVETPAEEPAAFVPIDEMSEAAPPGPAVAEPVPGTVPTANNAPVTEDETFAAWLNESEDESAAPAAEAFQPIDEAFAPASEPMVPEPDLAEPVANAESVADPEPVVDTAAAAESAPVTEDGAFAAWLNESPEQPIDESPATFEPIDESPDTSAEPILTEPFAHEPVAEQEEDAPAAWLNEPQYEATPEASQPVAETLHVEPEPVAFEPTEAAATDEDAFAAWLGEPEAAAPEQAEDMFAPVEEIELNELDMIAEPPVEFIEPQSSEPVAEAESDPALELELPPDLPEPPGIHAEESESPLSIGEPAVGISTDDAEAAVWDFRNDTPAAEASPVLPAERVTEDEMPEAAAAMDELGLTPEAATESPASPLEAPVEDETPFDAFVENGAFIENGVPAAPVADDPLWAPDDVASVEPSNEFEAPPEENFESAHDELFSTGVATSDANMFDMNGPEPTAAVEDEGPAMFEPMEEEPPVAAAEAIGFDLAEPVAPQSSAPAAEPFELQAPGVVARQVADVGAAPAPQPVPVAPAPAKRSWWPFGRKARDAAEKTTPQPVAEAQVAVRKPLASIPIEASTLSESVGFAAVATVGAVERIASGRRRINIGEGPSGELDTLDVMFPPIETVPPLGSTAEQEVAAESAAAESLGFVEANDVESIAPQVAEQPELEATLWTSEPEPTIAFESPPAASEASPWDMPEASGESAVAFDDAEAEEEIPILEFEEESAGESEHDKFIFADDDTSSGEDVPVAFDNAPEAPSSVHSDLEATSAWDQDAIPVLDLDEAPEAAANDLGMTLDFSEISEPAASQESDDDLLDFLNEAGPTGQGEPVNFAADESSDVIEFAEEPPVGDASLPSEEVPATPDSPAASSSSTSDDDDLADFLRELGH